MKSGERYKRKKRKREKITFPRSSKVSMVESEYAEVGTGGRGNRKVCISRSDVEVVFVCKEKVSKKKI